ncbi:MAG TPA: ArsR family transcriptional regulator [Bacilli bacterium]|nr:ArsR family transcriptional regulator [Bacilli bacterium]
MRKLTLNLNDDGVLEKIGDSFSSPIRRKILRLVANKSYSIYEIAQELNLSMSTTSFHIKILKEAKLIKAIPSPSKKGNEKNVSIECESMTIFVNGDSEISNLRKIITIPLGSFIDYDITPPCVICTKEMALQPIDDRNVFLSPTRIQAQLISFYKGHITFPIPLDGEEGTQLESITIFMELCSECPNYNNSWKSDITFWLNGQEIATYLSLRDYGDRRGAYTPSWWPSSSTQYGMPVNLRIDTEGTYINGAKANSININSLGISNNEVLHFTLGVKDDAKYVGGINIFGKNFGDINEDITVQIAFERKK